MTDTPSPALSDEELRETLDLLSTVLDRVNKTATKARQAAFSVKTQTDLERFKARLPWFGLAAAVLAVAMTVGLPRFLAGDGATCVAMERSGPGR